MPVFYPGAIRRQDPTLPLHWAEAVLSVPDINDPGTDAKGILHIEMHWQHTESDGALQQADVEAVWQHVVDALAAYPVGVLEFDAARATVSHEPTPPTP